MSKVSLKCLSSCAASHLRPHSVSSSCAVACRVPREHLIQRVHVCVIPHTRNLPESVSQHSRMRTFQTFLHV